MFVTSYCVTYCIHSGTTGNFFSLVFCSLWWVQIVGYVLACRSYLFACTLHHLIIIIVQTLSEDIELIKCLSDIIYKMPVRFVECVSKIKHILSVIHYTICGAVCLQFTYFLRDDWDNIYTLSYYHHQIGSMNYYPFVMKQWYALYVFLYSNHFGTSFMTINIFLLWFCR